MTRLALALALLTTPAFADVAEVVQDHIEPGLEDFAASAKALDSAAQSDCRATALVPGYHAAFDAWMGIADIRIGPSEAGALSISFWPDKKGFTTKALNQLISNEDPRIADPAHYAEISIAARGFFALERMLFDASFNDYEPGDYSCQLVQAMISDLAKQADDLMQGWQAFAPALTAPGQAGNTTYLDEAEAQRAIYTQILSALEWTAATRLARPLGDTTRSRPTRAEAWRSGRSVTNAVLASEAAVHMAEALADFDLPQTQAALERVLAAAAKIEDGSLQDIDDLSHRFRLEVLQQEITGVAEAIGNEIGVPLGLTAGFNSSDGD